MSGSARKAKLLRELVNGALIVLGILAAGMGPKGFLLSSSFIDGGVAGVFAVGSRGWSEPGSAAHPGDRKAKTAVTSS